MVANKTKKFLPSLLSVLLAGGLLSSRVEAQNNNFTAAGLTDEQVVGSLNKGIDWLFNAQQNGVWETSVWRHDGHVYTGGHTTVVLYSLLHVGESLKDPRLGPKSKQLEKAIAETMKINTDLGYLRAFQCIAMSQAVRANDNVKKALPAVAGPLINAFPNNGVGGYMYRLNEPNKQAWDNSATQLALLGLWGVADAGIEIPLGYWNMQDRYWRNHQLKDGSWGYRTGLNPDKPYASLSAAGVASLYITNEQKNMPLRLTNLVDKNIEAGMKWLDDNIDMAAINFKGEPSGYWTSFAVERVALYTGRKYIGGKDWYRTGAATIMNLQENDGKWPNGFIYQDNEGHFIPTALSLMFLARGRNPTAFAKLEYPGNTWNARTYDLYHLSRWISQKSERTVNWQTVSFANQPEEWLDAPVLLITGSVDPKFTDEQLAKIRAFVEAGGLVFSSADGGTTVPSSVAFSKAMMEYAQKITDNQYEPREIPAESPIYSCWGKIKGNLRVKGLSNGSRELWVHSDADLGATWERLARATEDHWTLPTNVFIYASGGGEGLAPRLRSMKVEEIAATGPAINVARVEWAGNWNPEPGAWKRFAKVMAKDAQLNIVAAPVKLDALDPKVNRVAHLTGTEGFKLGDGAIAKLQAYVKGGGTLIIEPCGGSEKALEGAKELIQKIYPDHDTEPVAMESAVLNGTVTGSAKIEAFGARLNVLTRNRKGSKLLGVKVGNRYGILLTQLDMTSGLLNTQTLGIAGFTPESSVALMRNLIMYGNAETKPSIAVAEPAK